MRWIWKGFGLNRLGRGRTLSAAAADRKRFLIFMYVLNSFINELSQLADRKLVQQRQYCHRIGLANVRQPYVVGAFQDVFLVRLNSLIRLLLFWFHVRFCFTIHYFINSIINCLMDKRRINRLVIPLFHILILSVSFSFQLSN